MRTLALTPFLFLPLQEEAEPAPPAGVEVTHLGNEGFLLHTPEAAVLLDAFLEERYSVYEPVPPARRGPLLAGEAPFDGDVLCLVSHVHRDHFQPAPAARYLRNQPRARLVGTPQVIEALRAEAPVLAGTGRVLALTPAEGAERRTWFEDAVEVRFLDLPHGGRFRGKIQNRGHEVRLGGLLFLHVGDADLAPETWRALEMQERSYDVALLPYWAFESGQGRRLIRDVVRARHYVACHVPPEERTAFRERVRAEWPALWVPAPTDAPRRFAPAGKK